MKHYVAIDIGGTNIKYGLIDEAEILVEAHEMPTEASLTFFQKISNTNHNLA